MSDMKCPVCQNNLHKINIIVSTCTNDKCKLWGSSIPNLVLEALAQAKQDLERTHKALNVAVDALNKINMRCQNTVRNHLERATIRGELCDISFYARKAINDIDNLEQITALEQKDNGGNK